MRFKKIFVYENNGKIKTGFNSYVEQLSFCFSLQVKTREKNDFEQNFTAIGCNPKRVFSNLKF